jgi:4-hydroxy-tetrahydrodipicolinate synthase
MTERRTITGVIPAALTPFDERGEIHLDDLRRHLGYLAGTEGVTGVTVNGHAGEVASLSIAEQQLVLRTARETLTEGQLLVAGVYAHSTREARSLAALAVQEGADVLLVFPPEVWEFGVADDPRLAYRYYAAISEASGLPIIAFVYPAFSPLHLPTDVVMRLCSEVPAIAAVKEWSNDMVIYETTLRRLRAEHPHVSMLSSYSKSLLGSLALGADGILSGHASLIPEIQAELFAAVGREDLEAARRLAAALHELTQVFYAPPVADGFTRMKHASVRLGRISCATVREPLLPLEPDAIAAVDAVLPLLERHAAPDASAAGAR